MVLQQPLFMQAGQYTAAADRYLIGSMLFPSGNENIPRPGIRPSGTLNSDTNLIDLSMKVKAPVGTSQSGEVVVNAGVAYVAGPASQTLNGVYLVVNDGEETVNLNEANSGARTVKLYVEVVTGQTVATSLAKFTVVEDGEDVPTDSVLLLAEIMVDGNNRAATFTDKRVYTTSHGGVLLVQDASELAGADNDIASAPLGSQAFAIMQKALYMRTFNGWEVGTVIRAGLTADLPPKEKSPIGYEYFDTQRRLLQIFSPETTEPKYLTIGSVPGMARVNTSGATFGGERRVGQTAFRNSGFELTPDATEKATEYKPIESLPPVAPYVSGIEKPTSSGNAFELRFMVMSSNTVVTAVLSAEMYVYDNGHWGQPDSGMTVEVALQVLKYGASVPEAVYPYRYQDITYPWLVAGLRFTGMQDYMKSRTVVYQLEPGEYLLRPMFHGSPGAVGYTTAARDVHIAGYALDVSL